LINLDSHKLLKHIDRLVEWKHGNRIPPITIDMALTRACNYNCIYCYSQLQENECKPMTWEVLKNFLDDAKEIGVKAISLVSDGESTLSPHYVRFIQYGWGIGIDMALGTNGYALTEEALGKILPCLTYIRFNMSSGQSETYAKWHGVNEMVFERVLRNIIDAVTLKRHFALPVTIGIQMVFLPEMINDVLPLARVSRSLGVDYLVIKHCSDDEKHTLGIDYEKYKSIEILNVLQEAEAMTNDKFQVAVKWSKLSTDKRSYSKCFGPQFIPQISGSGLFAPCGCFFNDKYKKYHIGNISEMRFKDIFYSDRYKNVMDELASEKFDAKTMCGSNCLQHKCNEFLNELMMLVEHRNFV